jgi:hypothetical protein
LYNHNFSTTRIRSKVRAGLSSAGWTYASSKTARLSSDGRNLPPARSSRNSWLFNHSNGTRAHRKIGLLWNRDVIEPRELFFLSCSTVAPHIRWESKHYLGRAFRKSIKSQPDKVRASRRDCRYTGESIAIPKEKLRNSRDGAQSKNKAVSRL